MQSIVFDKFIEIHDQLGSAVAVFKATEDENDFVFVDFNSVAESLDNISKEALLGKKVTTVFPAVESFGLLDVFKQVYKDGKSQIHKISYYEDDRISGWRENLVHKLSDTHIISIYKDHKKHLKHLSRWSQVFQHAKWGVVIGNEFMEDMNETFAEMHGYTRNELIGKPATMLFAPEKVAAMRQENERAHIEGHNQFESIHIKKDGSRFPVLLDVTTIKNEKNEVDYHIVNIQDITKQKESQKEQIQYTQELKEILEFFPLPIIIYNQALEITFINRKFTDLLGYQLEEIPTLRDWTTKAIPDKELYKEYSLRWQNDIQNAHRTPEEIHARIYKICDKKQQVRHLEISFKVHLDSRIACFNDLTELLNVQKDLEESRARFKLFMDHFPGAAFIKNHKGKFFFVNKWHTKNLNREESQILKSSPEEYWPQNKEQIRTQDQLVIKTNSPQDFNDIILHQDGNHHYLTRKFPIPFDNAPTMIGGISLDVTDKYFIEKEKEEMHQQVLHSAKLASIGELAAGIAHEIRNPLTIIKGHNENILQDLRKNSPCTKNTLELLRKQETAIERIATIVNGLKNFARSDADVIENINIHKAINETLDLISHIYQKDGVKINTKYSSHRDLHINGNFGKFQQVIMNLLSNAKYAMRDQAQKIIVVETSKRKEFIKISITDHGIGIDKKYHNQIFDPFFTTKPFGEGTGLGLGIIKSIIEGINGKIDFESAPGKTTFTLTIPLTNSRHHNTQVAKTQKYYRLRGNALIVDDEEDIREILSCYMEDFGLTTCEAENGREALKCLDKELFDVIITDMKMPIMDGWELLKHLEKSDIKKIVISGNLTNAETTTEVDAYLEKPFDKEKMYQTLTQVLARK